jgi:hypothetical protein
MNRHALTPAEVSALEQEMKAEAEAALAQLDWQRAEQAARGWSATAGGARLPDPWLVQAASALIHGRPRTAVQALDLGLGHWVSPAPDRAILLAVRGWIILESLRDPKTAVEDFVAAHASAPRWLAAAVNAGYDRCQAQGPASRKRKRSVGTAPPAPEPPTGGVARGAVRVAGSRPSVWAAVAPHLPVPT